MGGYGEGGAEMLVARRAIRWSGEEGFSSKNLTVSKKEGEKKIPGDKGQDGRKGFKWGGSRWGEFTSFERDKQQLETERIYPGTTFGEIVSKTERSRAEVSHLSGKRRCGAQKYQFLAPMRGPQPCSKVLSKN